MLSDTVDLVDCEDEYKEDDGEELFALSYKTIDALSGRSACLQELLAKTFQIREELDHLVINGMRDTVINDGMYRGREYAPFDVHWEVKSAKSLKSNTDVQGPRAQRHKGNVQV